MNADFFNFPEKLKDVFLYTFDSTTTTGTTQFFGAKLFEKPKGCSFIYCLAVGGRGGGGSSSATGGGGGGGAGGVITTIIPYAMCPDRLFVRVGAGGTGGTSGGAGLTGGTSSILMAQIALTATPSNTIISATGGAGSVSFASFATFGAVTARLSIVFSGFPLRSSV